MDESRNDLFKKVRNAASAGEIQAIAAEMKVELPLEQAEELYSSLAEEGPLSEDDLERVAAGWWDYRYGPGPTW